MADKGMNPSTAVARLWRWLLRPGYSPWTLIYMSNFASVVLLAWGGVFASYRIRGAEIPDWIGWTLFGVFGFALVDMAVSTARAHIRNRRSGRKATIRQAEEAWLRDDYEQVTELLSPFRNELDWVLMRRLIVSERRTRKSASTSDS